MADQIIKAKKQKADIVFSCKFALTIDGKEKIFTFKVTSFALLRIKKLAIDLSENPEMLVDIVEYITEKLTDMKKSDIVKADEDELYNVVQEVLTACANSMPKKDS